MIFGHFKWFKDQGKETQFKSHAKFRKNGECLTCQFDFLFSARCTVLVTALVVVGLCLDRILGHHKICAFTSPGVPWSWSSKAQYLRDWDLTPTGPRRVQLGHRLDLSRLYNQPSCELWLYQFFFFLIAWLYQIWIN